MSNEHSSGLVWGICLIPCLLRSNENARPLGTTHLHVIQPVLTLFVKRCFRSLSRSRDTLLEVLLDALFTVSLDSGILCLGTRFFCQDAMNGERANIYTDVEGPVKGVGASKIIYLELK